MGEEVSEKPKKKHHLKISWWLVILAVVVFGGVGLSVSAIKNAKPATNALVKTAPDTANEIKIKQNISSLRGDVNKYFETNKTYVGWTPNTASATKIQGFGTDLKTKLGPDTYMVYALMPSSKLVFCMDSTGFTGEMNKLTGKDTCNK